MIRGNLPNLLTIGRFALTPVVVILLTTDAFLAGVFSAILITVAGISDIIDGVLARHWKVETDLGRLLDPVADKTLVMAALIMLTALGRVHPIIVVIIVSRETLITGIRAIAGAKSLVIPAAVSGKYKTAFQMVAIGALSVHETVIGINAHLLGLLCLYISIGFSIYSAVEYIRLFGREVNIKILR